MPTRRSAFIDKLLTYDEYAFTDGRETQGRGRWREYLQDRIGSSFSGRIVLEVGCHNGTLFLAAARAHPTTGFLGLDWTPRHLLQAAERVAAQSLRNVALLHGRAQDLGRMVSDGELDELWLFHPEPHDLPQLLFDEPFLLRSAQLLRSSGHVCLKTDHPGYFQHALALMGLAEPQVFTQARSGGGPRMKRTELFAPESLPQPSIAVMDKFTVGAMSTDYWHDAKVQSQTASRAFAGRSSGYEQRFRQKRLPIYYLELVKRDLRA